MKKKEKTVCQIIRFRGNIDTFLVLIEKFARFNNLAQNNLNFASWGCFGILGTSSC